MKGLFKLYIFKLIILSLTIIFISFSSFSQVSIVPIVYWENYPAYVKIGIENSINEKSCSGLRRAFVTAMEKKDYPTKWFDVTSYLLFHLKKFNCM